MKSFNVVVTVSTTICVDANTPEDAIKKVQKALDAACAALAQEAIPYSLDCQRHILVDENHYFEAIDVFDDYDIDFDVIRNF